MRKRAALALLLLVVSAVLGATVLREPISLAATPFQNVIVANTADNPVPVRQQGTANVAVVDDREPFEENLQVSLDDGQFQDQEFFQVAADKRLVVQYVSVFASVPPDQGLEAFVSVNGRNSPVALHSQGLRSLGFGNFIGFAGDAPMVGYVDGGGSLRFTLARESSTVPVTAPGRASATAFVSGYLEPMP